MIIYFSNLTDAATLLYMFLKKVDKTRKFFWHMAHDIYSKRFALLFIIHATEYSSTRRESSPSSHFGNNFFHFFGVCHTVLP